MGVLDSHEVIVEAGDSVADLLAYLHESTSSATAVGSAMAIALSALGFIREATGDRGAEGAADMLRSAIELRQDRPRPRAEARK